MTRIKSFFADHFSLDLRSLALMRILLSLVLLADLSIRISDLTAFYTDAGIVPRSLLQFEAYDYTNPYFFSLLNISGHWLPVLILYLAGFVSVIHMLVGYRTRWFTIITWILLVSIQNRNPFIIQGGDGYLRLILFWGMFLPWGARYSIDSAGTESTNNKHSSLAGFAYIFQVISLYFFTGMLKNGEEWRSSFTAMYYALSLDQLVKPIGKFLLPYYEILEYLTITTLVIEFLIPVLLLIPFRKQVFRGIALILVVSLHLGIEVMMQVGLFSFISIAAASALAPTGFMDRLERGRIFNWVKGFNLPLFYDKLKSRVPRIKINWPNWFQNSRRRLATIVVAVSFAIGLFWNLSTLYEVPPVMSKVIDPVGAFVRLDQHWGMFAPSVFKEDGWYIKEGYSGDEKIDLYTYPDSITYDKPRLAVRQYKSARWRKFGENLIFVDNIPVRETYCNYELQKWNRNHPNGKLDSLKIIYMMEPTEPDYQAPTISREELCGCSAED